MIRLILMKFLSVISLIFVGTDFQKSFSSRIDLSIYQKISNHLNYNQTPSGVTLHIYDLYTQMLLSTGFTD